MDADTMIRILLVDDDENLLASMKRLLRKHLELETANSGDAALRVLSEDAVFDVIVSDQRMPGMSGIQLLKTVEQRHPGIQRIMLTGNADQQTAIQAVNQGHIFRFLTKPCPPATLMNAIQDAAKIARQREQDRQLLEASIMGAIGLATDIMGHIHPEAFSQAARLRQTVSYLGQRLELGHAWMYTIAASLSQFGCIVLEASLLQKANEGTVLSPKEKELFRQHPAIGAAMLSQLPNLELVASIVENQLALPEPSELSCPLESLSPVRLGVQLIDLAVSLDRAMLQGRPVRGAIKDLKELRSRYREDLLECLLDFEPEAGRMKSRPIKLSKLLPGMMLGENLMAGNGILLAQEGQKVTNTMIERFKAFANSVGLQEPIYILQADLDLVSCSS